MKSPGEPGITESRRPYMSNNFKILGGSHEHQEIQSQKLKTETVQYIRPFEKPLKFAGKWASHVARVVKNSPANAGDLRDPVSILGSGRSPGEGPMATHSNILRGKIIGKRSLVGYSP